MKALISKYQLSFEHILVISTLPAKVRAIMAENERDPAAVES